MTQTDRKRTAVLKASFTLTDIHNKPKVNRACRMLAVYSSEALSSCFTTYTGGQNDASEADSPSRSGLFTPHS